MRATSVTLLDLIRRAYVHSRFVDDRVLGMPGWVDSERFDMEAKVEVDALPVMEKLSDDQRVLALDSALARLLADRCKLAIHKNTKEGPAYSLTLVKSGSRLKPGTPIDKSFEGISTGTMRITSGSLTAQDVFMERLTDVLTSELDRPVVDSTGLTGRYDFKLEWTPETTAAPTLPVLERNAPGRPLADPAGPAIFTALQQQLGLKLEPTRVTMEVLVIDHVERPSQN